MLLGRDRGEANESIADTVLHFFAACTSNRLEIHTTEAVDVYAKPTWPELGGNRKIGTLPPMTTLPVKREVLRKDLAAYEIEFIDSNKSAPIQGFVLLGARGLNVREAGQKGGG